MSNDNYYVIIASLILLHFDARFSINKIIIHGDNSAHSNSIAEDIL